MPSTPMSLLKNSRIVRTSVYCTAEQLQRLERLAAGLGLHHTRGPGKKLKLGSISRLLRSIADGELIVTRADQQQ